MRTFVSATVFCVLSPLRPVAPVALLANAAANAPAVVLVRCRAPYQHTSGLTEATWGLNSPHSNLSLNG
ncbi:hypothetical protein GCM10025779_18380 [Arthrobacter cryoconiti]